MPTFPPLLFLSGTQLSLRAVVDMIEVKPGFEPFAKIVSFDFFAAFQLKIVVGFSALAGTFGEVRTKEEKTESAAYSDDEEVVGHGKFLEYHKQ